jgi:LL-diaminopimelate aminotransferase
MQSRRLGQLPPYLFVEIDRKKEAILRTGRPVLDLGIGDPDLGGPPELVEALKEALGKPELHRYPSESGLPELVDSIRKWAHRFHGVSLRPEEILVTIGSKEAIGHLPLAVVNSGETVLIPDPGYPVYNSSAVFAGAETERLPLLKENGYLPEFGSIPDGITGRARLLFLNYPNNPTASVSGAEMLQRAVDFCAENDIILVNDAAYSEIFYKERPAVLFPAARDSGAAYIEFFSFSKTFSITGWRIGYAIGSPDVIAALKRLKANIDSGVFGAIQYAVAVSLEKDYDEITGRIMRIYGERRDILARSLERGGYSFDIPQATFYFWIAVPCGGSSVRFCGKLLEETGIVATPGIGFGSCGEGYFRLSITSPTDTIQQVGEILEERGGAF